MSLQIHLVHWNYVTETLDLPISWFLSASRPWFHLHSVHIPQILLCTLRLEPWLEVLTRGPRGSAPLMTTRWRSSLRRSQYLWSVEWVPTLEASCHSLAQLEISVRTALTRTAVREFLGHEKCSQFQRSSKWTYNFPWLIKIKHLFPPPLWVGAVWQGGEQRMVPIKIGFKKGPKSFLECVVEHRKWAVAALFPWLTQSVPVAFLAKKKPLFKFFFWIPGFVWCLTATSILCLGLGSELKNKNSGLWTGSRIPYPWSHLCRENNCDLSVLHLKVYRWEGKNRCLENHLKKYTRELYPNRRRPHTGKWHLEINNRALTRGGCK